jgi:site-specific DNA recombinase
MHRSNEADPSGALENRTTGHSKACNVASGRAAKPGQVDRTLNATVPQEVQQQRTVAQARLTNLTSRHGANQRMSRDDIHAMVSTLGGLLNALRHADPADKAEIYRELGVRLTYDHTEHTVLAETRPTSSVCVVSVSEGGLDHYAHVLNQRKLLVVG